jgi:alanyl-tRNA synthetase
VLITTETSIGSGVRRVEALTGAGADEYVAGLRATVAEVASLLKAPTTEVVEAVRGVQERLREAERGLQQARGRVAALQATDLLARAQAVNGTRVLAARADAGSMEALKQLGDQLRERLGTGVVVLGTVVDSRPTLLAMASRDVVARGLNAGLLVKQVADLMGGGGGGRPEMGQAGGGDPARMDAALGQVRALVEARLNPS